MEFSYEIKKEIEVLSEGRTENAFDTVVNLISWNGGPVKLDIRKWSKDRTKMGKGISLNPDELSLLKQCIDDIVDF